MSDTMTKSILILVIEDDPVYYGLVATYLLLSGLSQSKESLIWAKSLAEGIEAAHCLPPDIVLLDLSLPDSTGLHTVQAMCAALPGTAIVVLTGHDDNRVATEVLQAGAQDYLVKGQFEHTALERAIRHALVRSALEQELANKNQQLQALHKSNMEDLSVAKDILEHIMHSDGLLDADIRYFQRATQQFSGDFIAVARDELGDLRIILADVTGHGLQAALFLLPIFRTFHTMVKKGLSTPKIVTELNQTMREIAVTTGRFIAAAVAHIARDGTAIEVWNGGIPNAIYLQMNGEIHSFRSRHLPLGVVDGDDFEDDTEILHAQPGVLLLCTDGLTEAENIFRSPFGEAQFEHLLKASAPDKIFDELLLALEHHLNGAPPHDDISMVQVRCGLQKDQHNA